VESASSEPKIRVVSGEVEAKAVTSRTVLPSAGQGPWPPFERVGEIVATAGRKLPAHAHEHQEVVTYVIEGFATHVLGAAAPEPLRPRSVVVLAAPGKITHALSPAEGSTIRWASVVVALPPASAGAPTEQRAQLGDPAPQPDGTVVRRLVGAGGLRSQVALECDEIEFVASGTSFRRIGHDRRAVLYAFRGRGRVDAFPVEEGEAALIERVSGIGLHGEPGFRALLASVPRGA
jgi:redox-sensitive bicupin YhaK (pirin superfamily)